MKKTFLFLPVIACMIFFLCILAWMGVGSIDWSEAIPIIAAFLAAGVLLCKNIVWGGLMGMLPAIYFISFGTHTYTGIELPLGMILLGYYAICSFVVYRKRVAKN